MSWHQEAECRNHDTHLWETANANVTTEANRQAARICGTCPVRLDCLDEAMRVEAGTSFRFHIWGGLTPLERRAIDLAPKRAKRKDRVA